MNENPVQPVAGVSVCVVRDGLVLLVKRANKAAHGLWSLPGGRIELGEPVRDAALRELKEETGIEAELIRLLDCIDIIHKNPSGLIEAHFILTVYGARWTRGKVRAASDASDARWVALDDLGGYQMTPGTPALLSRAVPSLTKN